MHIHNLSMRALRVIEEDLQEVRFLHVSLMLGGCKLDPTLISALVKRWRPKTHTFHLLCNECTITPEDVALKLNLLINGLVVAGAVYVGDWSGICNVLLGKVSEKFFGRRIKMKWLEENFNYLNNSAIMGMVPTTIFTSPSERPLSILIRNKVNYSVVTLGPRRIVGPRRTAQGQLMKEDRRRLGEIPREIYQQLGA
ncbi:hypothetical protein Goshw_005678 [Gossypium schwendimanii]|uniref:Aminotransferase-like plant mobile domain-containing protein n=1 Tax=Gossypium schwendimanii TaxID=34291 RepID=A0A7J9N3T4_GOSSC|nr:hypothetical protein [Gossypium schwendimanii]